MNKKYIVRLSDAERQICGDAVRTLKGGSQKSRRAQILLKADADGPAWTDEKIRAAIGCRVQTVECVRKRFVKFIDIFSIMPYHARFGHQQDPAWIARQIQDLGKLLNLKGTPDEKQKIWPIVQLADWGPTVDAEQIPQILDYGTRIPATGVMVFHWSGVSQQWVKVESLGKVYQAMRPAAP